MGEEGRRKMRGKEEKVGEEEEEVEEGRRR